MEVSKALIERRTIRKFTQKRIEAQDLTDLIEYARLAAYPANMQPLKFAVISDAETVDKVFPFTKWAGYLPETGTPKEGERPTAYIAILGDKSIKNSFEVEAGAAVTSMMLGAWEKGIASCWIGSLNRKELMELFKISEDDYALLYILALGYPAQKSQACNMTDSVRYFEDENKTINVPKRSVEEVLIEFKK
ncbi:MAG: nitroreductase family protein [Clostridia bacterium]|nr:nitroreductase family protein [Clostridia bacterium]